MFYGVGVYEVGVTVSYSEAVTLATTLLMETGSLYTASKMRWQRTFSREEVATLELIDLTLMANSKKGRKPKLTPKPWEKAPEKMGVAIEKNKFISLLEKISSGKIKVKPLKGK